MVSLAGRITARTPGRPLDGEVSVHRGPGLAPTARTRAGSGGMFQLRYAAPVASLLRLVIAGAPGSIDVPIDMGEAGVRPRLSFGTRGADPGAV